ncbi:uncharacterized protein [Eurosta solidaginis]|uniref:uncharacterized protein n=1 Tax=Eurosta solidaginis TaxID=178769 RepID=UPI0035309FDF
MDLSTKEFLNALKRFILTRRCPARIWSDNATNFVGAKNELAELRRLFLSDDHAKAVHEFCLDNYIDWRFIPPCSPHFGGLWESALKTAKHHFYRTAANSLLIFDELIVLGDKKWCQKAQISNTKNTGANTEMNIPQHDQVENPGADIEINMQQHIQIEHLGADKEIELYTQHDEIQNADNHSTEQQHKIGTTLKNVENNLVTNTPVVAFVENDIERESCTAYIFIEKQLISQLSGYDMLLYLKEIIQYYYTFNIIYPSEISQSMEFFVRYFL